MKEQFRLFRRGGVFYSHATSSGQQKSLKTKDRKEARRILAAMNEATHAQAVNLLLARVYLTASEPKMATRTWFEVAYAIFPFKSGTTAAHWKSVLKDEALQKIYRLKLIETTADHFLEALKAPTVSTNMFLRRLHNFALDMNWLLSPVIPKRQWPGIHFKSKRAITTEEHEQIIVREHNPERELFYELCWHLGGSQSDIAQLHAEDVDRTDQTVSFVRQKPRNRSNLQPPIIHFGPQTKAVFAQLPQSGPLFPYLASV